MSLQTKNGKSFEYAVAIALAEQTGGRLVNNVYLTESESNFLQTSPQLSASQLEAARKAVGHLQELGELEFPEPNELEIRLSSDASGQKGDVRDVVISDSTRSLGISCKNNHRAFKHSRLSASIDFVKKWNLNQAGASESYWTEVLPIFQELRKMKILSNGTASWNELPSKLSTVYSPILSAFENEISRLVAASEGDETVLTRNFIDYVVGKQDFYKFILTSENIEIIGFNFHNSLVVANSKYPTSIFNISRDTDHPSTTILRFKEGHTFSFRIHSASTKIEPSLKFDIQALALPSHQVYSNHINF